jgi:KpsF/GutQ family protein
MMNRKELIRTVREVWTAEADSVGKLEKAVDADSVLAVIELLAECKKRNRRIVTTGCGTSAAAARKIAHTLSCIEIPAFFLSPSDSVHGAMGAVQGGDAVIAVSKGGGTEEVMKMVPAIRAKGAKLIGVTENEGSALAEQSDLVLKVKVEKEPDPFNMLATASTMAVIAVFDAIAVALMRHTGYTKEKFAVIHPGGAVGERLTKGESGGDGNENDESGGL